MPGTEFSNYDRSFSPFWFDDLLSPEGSAALHSILGANAYYFEQGSIIKSEAGEATSIFVVLDGWASLVKSLPEGQTQIIDFGLPGDFFDLSGTDGLTVTIGMEAVTGVTVALVPFKDWMSLEVDYPEMVLINKTEAAAIRSRVAERMLRLGQAKADERLAYALLELSIRTGAFHDHRLESFHVPLTQQMLGNFVGLTSVHVSRVLSRLVQDKLIAKRDGIDISVIDKAALEDMAGISAEALANNIKVESAESQSNNFAHSKTPIKSRIGTTQLPVRKVILGATKTAKPSND